MKFENDDEKNAFEFVCQLASIATDRICNDLSKEDYEKFKHLNVLSGDIKGNTIVDGVKYDFDVIEWLRGCVEE